VHCLSSDVKRYGKDRHGHQRWYCYRCHRTYHWHGQSTHHFHWFRLWMIQATTSKELARQNYCSPSTVRRVILYWLERPPESVVSYSTVRHIILDGSFLRRNKGLYVAMDAYDHHIIHGGYNIREGGKDLKSIYQHLAARGLHPESATVDGNPQQINYLYAQWPMITIQRCVVHVQRQGLSWCRRTPKRTDAKHLRKLFLLLTDVQTEVQVNKFLRGVDLWERRFGPSLASSLNRGKVFGDVLRARSMLLKALPNLFHYVSNKNIVRSTNALEGYFSRLKEHYRRHRGLSPKHRKEYFQWYFHLVPK